MQFKIGRQTWIINPVHIYANLVVWAIAAILMGCRG